jgi:hypothetical protein
MSTSYWRIALIFFTMSGMARGEDSFVGKKPPLMVASAWNSLPLTGKLPAPLEISITPPRGAGPGLRFDTSRYFYVYTDQRSSANHFAPSGWMGDHGDISVQDGYKENVADGRTCMKVIYSARGAQGYKWAGIYWQEPAGNWGQQPGGFNVSRMTHVTFWARGQKGGETIGEFKIGGIEGAHPDSGAASIGPVTLNQEWTQYAIDLEGVDLSKISGGFAWSANRLQNPEGMTFYLDEIRYERMEPDHPAVIYMSARPLGVSVR